MHTVVKPSDQLPDMLRNVPSDPRSAAPSVDRRGVRFEQDGRVFRAFRSDLAPFYRSLLESPAAEKLFDAGLVRSWISPVRVDGFELVVESERVPVVTYPLEWSTAMLREAGRVIARLAVALADMGLGLSDAHPWNVLFHDTRGLWIDLGSLVDDSRVTDHWIREYRAHIVVPLALHAHRWHAMADAVAAEHRVVRAKRLWDRRPLRDWYPPGYAALRSRRHDAGSFYRGLVEYIDGLDVRPRESDWSGYVQSPDATVGAPETYDGKQRAVDTFLGCLPPGRVLDVGANRGWFSELAVHHGHDVTAVDTDDPTSSALFARARALGLPILPLRMDIMWPTPGHGMALAYPPAPARLRSEISLWLALVHHLARSGYSFEAVASTVAEFTGHAAIIEFVPHDDPHIAAWPLVRDPGYDQERFIEAMRPQFPSVEVMPSSPDPRVMMLFRRA